MNQWYALHTKPNSEYRVNAALQQHKIETYLPEVVIRHPEKKQRFVPFFPSYLFMKVDMRKTNPAQWLWTPGLRRIVTIGDEPEPVPQQAIDLIRHKLDDINTRGGFATQQFQAGDTVQITRGPLSGLLATFEKPTSSEERVQVLLNFFGRMNQIKIETYSLEKVSNERKITTPQSSRRRRTRGRGRRVK
jgi:transcriptional antiterminator RfaH